MVVDDTGERVITLKHTLLVAPSQYIKTSFGLGPQAFTPQ